MQQKPINKTFLIIILGILAALGPFSIDMYLPAFKRISTYFNTDISQVAFTLTSYFLGISIGQLIYGPIVDKYGRKKPLLVGLAIYIIASIACAVSTQIQAMIAMRLLQALGGCVGMVASNAIISDVFEKEKMAKAFSSIMLVMGVAPLIAPSLGSIFLSYFDWYMIFIFLAVFAFLISLLIYFLLPETSQYMHDNKLKINIIAKDYYSIFRNRTFLNYTLISSLSMSILFAYIASASSIFQTFYGLSNTTFSLLFAINATGLIVGTTINGWLTKKLYFLSITKMSLGLLVMLSIAMMMILFVNPHLPYYYLVMGIFSTLFLIGFVNPNAVAASLYPFKMNVGAASALGGAIRMGVAALVAALVGLVNGSRPDRLYVIVFIICVISGILFLIAPKLEHSNKV